MKLEAEGGYEQPDRERNRGRKVNFWSGLEGMSSGVGLMADWEFRLGASVEVIRPFLEVTGERSETLPCPAVASCGCRHAVRETRRGELVAACCCEEDCGTYLIEAADVLFHGINQELFGRAICQGLGFEEPGAAAYVSRGLREIGRYAAVAVPVYFSMEDSTGLLREIAKMLGQREGPFLVLTPTGRSWGGEVEVLARPHAGGHVALSSVIAHEQCGMGKMERTGQMNHAVFRANGMLEPMLREFGRKIASLRDAGGTLRSIHREIAAVRSEYVELRSAKQQLEKLLGEGLLAFARKVDATSFKVVCTVLAEGDVAKASRTLGMPDGSVRSLMRRWNGMGKEYRMMLEMVRWRKRTGLKEAVPLKNHVLLGETKNSDYPEVMADLLEKVTEMSGENWQEKADELEEMLREMTGKG